LLAVELEHTLQTRLLNRPDSGVSKVLSDEQREWGVVLDASNRQALNALNAAVLEMRRQQHVRAPDSGREKLDGQAELVGENKLLYACARQQWRKLIAHRGQGQRVKAHTQ
jgi:hypothetical protein